MAYNEQDYTWAAWTQPALTSDTSFGTVTVSSTNADRPGYKALDGIKNNSESCWESEASAVSGWLKWELPCVLKISQIKLYNKYTGNTRLSKNVAAYADAEKTIPIGTQQTFPQEPYSLVTITPETPVITSVVYINMVDTYNLMVGLSEIEITAEIGTPKPGIDTLDQYLNTNEGMTALISSAKDDDTITCTGASWFKYNSVVCNNIYVSGNTWVGLGASAEHMKINRRDAKVHGLYRQEFTYKNRNVIKFRWEGYSVYNSTAATQRLTWELFLFSSGDLFLNVIDNPNDGTDSFDTIGGSGTFDLPAGATQLSLYCGNPADGKAFEIKNEKIQFMEVRYLIQGPDNTLYTLTDGALTPLPDQTLTGENFLNNGLQEPPNGTWITDLPNAKVLYWQDTLSDTVPKVTAALNANPPNQIVLTWEADMNHESILGINSMTADVDGFVSITLTFDHNATWWKFDGTEWAQTTQDAGMTKEVLNAITTEQWANLLMLVDGSLMYRVSFVLDETSVLKRFDVDYINP